MMQKKYTEALEIITKICYHIKDIGRGICL